MSVPRTGGGAALTDGWPETDTGNGPLEERRPQTGGDRARTRQKARDGETRRKGSRLGARQTGPPSRKARPGLLKDTEAQTAVAGGGSEDEEAT